jgi:hypothetical protein
MDEQPTTTEPTTGQAKQSTASRNRKLGVAAVVIVALAAGGAALAANKLHTSGSSLSGMRGGPPGFSGSGQGFPGGGPGGSGSFNGRRQFGYGGQGGPPSGGFRGRGFGGGMFGSLSAAVTYLGISQSSLRSQLAAGKTLAQVANATSGKSASGLIDAMVAAEKKQLEQAVASGRLTQSQADQLEASMKTRITAMVNDTFGPGRGGFGGQGRPPGGFGQGGGSGNNAPPTQGGTTT